MLVGTSLIASDKKCIAWVILSSTVTWDCVRYACKYLAVSVIINDLVFSVNVLDAEVLMERRSYTKAFSFFLVLGFSFI